MVTASPISTRDRELIAALDDPARLDPVEYAAWIERSEIRNIIAARDDLRTREEHAKLARFRSRILAEASDALDALKAVLACHPSRHPSCHGACHREAPSGDSPPSSSAPSKLAGADSPGAESQSIPDARVLTEVRRAASSITRLARACLTPLPHPAALRESAGAPSSPLGGVSRAPRPEGAPSPRGLSSSSTGQPTTRHAGPVPDTSSLGLSVPPSLPPSPPASSVPGLPETVAAFIRAAGTADGLQHAATHVAVHRKRALGPDLEPWLRALAQRLAHAEVVSGFTLPQDMLDCAVHAVTLTRPQGPLQALVHVVLERHPDGRNIWAVADVVTADSS